MPPILTSELDSRYSIDGESLIAKNPAWEVEIGDRLDASTFHPQLKLGQWDNEVNFSMRLNPAGLYAPSPITPIITGDQEKTVWTAGNVEARIYDLTGFSQGGQFEFEVWLGTKPLTNIVEFTITTKGLRFHKQPMQLPLGDNFIPDWAKGSYSVSHATKRNHVLGQKNYFNGKAFHIQRPKIFDRLGANAWCELDIDLAGDVMRVTIPQKFLDTAVYPVRLDPIIGKTAQGASTSSIENRIEGLQSVGSGDGGEVLSMNLWVHTNGAVAHFVKTAIYTFGATGSPIANGQTIPRDLQFGPPTLDTQFLFSVNPTLTPSTNYALLGWAEPGAGSVQVAEDTVAGTGVGDGQAFDGWPDPLVGSITSEEISIYATLAEAPLGANLPHYGQVIFNSADEENRPTYGQRIARGTE